MRRRSRDEGKADFLGEWSDDGWTALPSKGLTAGQTLTRSDEPFVDLCPGRRVHSRPTAVRPFAAAGQPSSRSSGSLVRAIRRHSRPIGGKPFAGGASPPLRCPARSRREPFVETVDHSPKGPSLPPGSLLSPIGRSLPQGSRSGLPYSHGSKPMRRFRGGFGGVISSRIAVKTTLN